MVRAMFDFLVKKRFLFPRLLCQRMTRRLLQKCIDKAGQDFVLAGKNRQNRSYHLGRKRSLEAFGAVLEDAWAKMGW